MKRGRSAGKPTGAQEKRMDAIAEIGCIVVQSLGIDWGAGRSRPRCTT